MADEIKKIITIDASKSIRTLREFQTAVDNARVELVKFNGTEEERQRLLVNLKKAQSDYNKEMRMAVKETDAAKGSYNDLLNQLNRLKETWKSTGDAAKRADLTKEINRVKGQLTELDHSIGNYQRNVGNYWNSLKAGFAAVTAGIMGVIAAIRTLSRAVKVIVEFEQSLANLGSILGATNEQMRGLEQSALQLGRTTEWTASQVVMLQTELAKLGFSSAAIENMQASVLQFATATGADLPRAAAFAGSALRAFGLVSSDTTDLLNVMAKATTSSALDFSKLETAISVVAPVAKSFGLNARDTAALLGTLANAGMDASTAATSLRNILLRYSQEGGKVQKAIGGQVHNFDELIASFRKLNDAGMDAGKAFNLIGSRGSTALVVLADMVNETEELRRKFDDVNGTLEEIQSRRLDTLSGEVKLLKSAWEGFQLALSDSKGVLRDIIYLATEAVNGITHLISRTSRVQSFQDPQQKELLSIYKKQGADAAKAAGEAFVANAKTYFDQVRGEVSKMGWIGMFTFNKATEQVEAAENALDYINKLIANDEAERKAADARIKQAKAQAAAEAQAEADKAEQERLRRLEAYWAQELDAFINNLDKETDAYAATLAKQDKLDADRARKRAQDAERNASRFRTGMNNRKLANVGQAENAAIVTARAEIDDEKTLTAAIYAIQKDANEKRLALLKQFEQDALKAGDPTTAIKYQQEAADLSVKIEQDAITEKARLRRQDTKDAQENAKRQIEAAQSIAGIFGSVASAYQAYLTMQVEGHKMEEEAAEKEFENVKMLQYAQTWINTLAGAVSVWAGEGTNATKAIQSAAVLAQGIAATMQIANTTLGSATDAGRAVTSAAVAAPVVINAMPQVQALTSASQEDALNARQQAQRVYVVYSDIAQAGRKVAVTQGESRF